jgi:Asp/Glu/hydantoin racemase
LVANSKGELGVVLGKIAYGGQNIYGYDIGILVLDSTFPRIVGDVGNAKTWNYPVLYRKVENATPQKVVLELDMDDIEPFIEAAKELEKCGVKAITTSCGFLSLFQDEIARELNIPIFTSALLLVPTVARMIGRNKKVGILTANKKTLSTKHLESIGADSDRCVIMGLEDKETFTNFTVQNRQTVDIDLCREELTERAHEFVEHDNTVGAIVLECANMPPFASDIQTVTNLPVFDIVTLTDMVQAAIVQKVYE